MTEKPEYDYTQGLYTADVDEDSFVFEYNTYTCEKHGEIKEWFGSEELGMYCWHCISEHFQDVGIMPVKIEKKKTKIMKEQRS